SRLAGECIHIIELNIFILEGRTPMRIALILFTTAALVAGSALTGSSVARDRTSRAEPPANQIADQADARTARIKADLRLTPEQEKNWSGFESAMHDLGKKQADRAIAARAEE